jgi:hypothetical protein
MPSMADSGELARGLPSGPPEPRTQPGRFSVIIQYVAESQNLFSIGRRRGDEDQLTEMLAWLATVVPGVAQALIELAFADVVADELEVDVSTQVAVDAGRLDALLRTPSTLLVIESKLDSAYGVGQIRKYIDWVASQDTDHPRKGLMTLTRALAPWTVEDVEHATALGVVPAQRRWEDLYDRLQSIASTNDSFGQSARLVNEFREMLSQEGLIPMMNRSGKVAGSSL